MSEHIYKQLHQDEEGRYFFATEDDTRYVVDQQSYLLIYLIELTQKILEKQEEKEISNNENAEGQNEQT